MNEKARLLTLNTPTACLPRAAVPVNTRAWIGKFVWSQRAKFEFGRDLDFPSYLR